MAHKSQLVIKPLLSAHINLSILAVIAPNLSELTGAVRHT